MSKRTPTCRWHCGGCHRHFTSLATFDAHRKGEYGVDGLDGRHCTEPEGMETVEGVCRMYGEPTEATIWVDGEARKRLREVFAGV